MKKLTAILLTFAMLLPLCACGETPVTEPEPVPAVSEQTPAPEPAAEPESAPAEPEAPQNTPVDQETAVQALYAVVQAYFNKNPYVQYEGKCMSIEDKQYGPQRIHHYAPPEYASEDQALFSQCTDYVVTLYHEAFGYSFMNGMKAPGTTPMNEQNEYPVQAVYLDGITEENVKEKVAELRAQLRPGDIIATAGDSGHALLWLGDWKGDGVNYVTHCWGSPIDPDTGKDPWESKGGIKIQPEDEVVFGPKVGSNPNWNLYEKSRNWKYISIIRPFAASDFVYEITPATVTRMQYAGMAIDRFTDVTKYQDVLPGQEITVTVSITNNGTEDYHGLEVKDALPEGVTLKSGETAWTLDVPAGKTESRSYTVSVTAKRGEDIFFPAGSVGNIPTREMTYRVGGAHLTQEQEAALTALTVGYFPEALQTPGLTELKFINDVYREVLGIELGLPESFNEYIGLRFDSTKKLGTQTRMIAPKEAVPEYRYLTDMELHHGLGGMYMSLGFDVMARAMEYREEYYRPGDIILTMSGLSTTALMKKEDLHVYICIGNGFVLTQDAEKGAVTAPFSTTVGRMIICNATVVLRPTLAWDDINAK